MAVVDAIDLSWTLHAGSGAGAVAPAAAVHDDPRIEVWDEDGREPLDLPWRDVDGAW